MSRNISVSPRRTTLSPTTPQSPSSATSPTTSSLSQSVSMSSMTASAANQPLLASGQLDAFKLRSPVAASQFPGRATAVAIFDEFVYVGFDSGFIYTYNVQKLRSKRPDEEREWAIVTKKRMGKKPIMNLAVMDPLTSPAASTSQASNKVATLRDEQALLFVLYDNHLTCHHPHTLDLLVDFASASNVILFTFDIKAPHHIATVSRNKKRVALYSYTIFPTSPGKQNSHTLIKELTLADTPLAMSWQGEWLCVAFKREYSLININFGDVKPVPVPMEGVNPCMCIAGNNELLMTSNTELGLFINFRGQPVPKNPIDWGGIPSSLTLCDHYVVGLFNDTPPPNSPSTSSPPNSPIRDRESLAPTVRIASLLDQRIKQSILLPRPFELASSQDKVVFLSQPPLASAPPELFVLYLVSLDEQIAQYMELSLTNEALSLLQRTKPSAEKLANFHIQAGFAQLRSLLVVSAFQHFTLSSVDPRELISLFPSLCVKNITYQCQYANTLGTISDIIEVGRQTAMQRSEEKKYKAVLSMSTRELIQQARRLLGGFLWDRRVKAIASYAANNKPTDLQVWEDTALLLLAVEDKEDRMEQERSPSNTSMTELPYTIEKLLFPINFCHVEECQSILAMKRDYNTLSSLYQSIGENRKALDVWVRLGSGEFKQRYDKKPDEAGVRETIALLSTLNDTPLLWEFAEWVLIRSSKAALRIFTSTQRSTPLQHEKVLVYLRRVSAKMSAAKTSPTQLNSVDLVEAYLEHITQVEKSTDSIYHTQLAITYLRKVLMAASAPEVRAQLAELKDSRAKLGTEPSPLGPARIQFYRFLQHSKYYETEQVLQTLLTSVFHDARKRGELEEGNPNDSLRLPKPIALFESKCIVAEEMILLFSLLNRHQSVLKLFIFALKDHIGATYYCLAVTKANVRKQQLEREAKLLEEREKSQQEMEKQMAKLNAAASQKPQVSRGRFSQSYNHHDSDENDDNDSDTEDSKPSKQLAPDGDDSALDETPHTGDVFLDLCDVYFSDDYFQCFASEAEMELAANHDLGCPPPTAYTRGCEVLVNYFSHLHPVKALRSIPPWVPVAPLASFFERMVPMTIHERRNAQLIKMLARTYHLRVQTASMVIKSNSLFIDSKQRCPWCQKPIGDSFFVAHPALPDHPDYALSIAPIPTRPTTEEDDERDYRADALEKKKALKPSGQLTYIIVHYQCASQYQNDVTRRLGAQINLNEKMQHMESYV